MLLVWGPHFEKHCQDEKILIYEPDQPRFRQNKTLAPEDLSSWRTFQVEGIDLWEIGRTMSHQGWLGYVSWVGDKRVKKRLGSLKVYIFDKRTKDLGNDIMHCIQQELKKQSTGQGFMCQVNGGGSINILPNEWGGNRTWLIFIIRNRALIFCPFVWLPGCSLHTA